MSDFATFVTLLNNWPTWPVDAPPLESGLACRLFEAIQALHDPARTSSGPLDIAGLVSHLLRHEAALHSDWGLQLRVPRAAGWPSATTWRSCLCDTVLTGTDHYRLRPVQWSPAWLGDSGPNDPIAAALREDQRRQTSQILADPVIRDLLGRAHYLSTGQRAAVRSAMLMQPGGAMLTVLPTGGGKSLTAFAPARIGAEQRGLTLVVVPTVALAIEQGRRARELFRRVPGAEQIGDWAYHGGLDNERKKALRQRVREGTQPMLFASPEAVVLSLRPALLAAAGAGLFHTFVIDEAHLVAQWGDEFRPDFQVLSGMRNALLAACPEDAQFRTLLLTATLTEEAWWTLRTLFGGAELDVCASVSLRPEPDYFVVPTLNEDERIKRVMELVHILPRPFIIYTTRRTDADAWGKRLREAGLRRMGVMHGETPYERREELLEQWGALSLDVMVATSAFGLGMDQSDVRAVVHACVPETVDRFYQEVGRGGRDGRACLSFLVHTGDDLRLAKSLNEDRIIGVDLGLARWTAMFLGATPCGGGDSVLVNLDAKHMGVRGDSDANVAWNVRTLVLMARAGLLTLEAHTPPQVEQEDGESDDSFAVRVGAEFARYSLLSRVRPACLPHLERATWDEQVAASRSASRRADVQAHQQVRALLDAKRAFADVFGETYTVPSAGIHPARGVGRCPTTRRQGEARGIGEAPKPEPLRRPIAKIDAALRAVLRDRVRLLVACPPVEEGSREAKKETRNLLSLVRRLVSAGIREIAAADEWLENADYRRLYRHAQPPFVLHSSLDEESEPLERGLAVPRLSILWPSCMPEHFRQALMLDRPAHIVLLPEDLPHPEHLARRFFETNSHISLDELNRRFDQWGS